MKAYQEKGLKTYQLYINGEWCPSSSSKTFERKNPATGDLVAEFQKASKEDAQSAILAAREAFDQGDWSSMSGAERSDLLYRAYLRIVEKTNELAELLSREMGKPLSEAKGEIGAVANIFSYYAGLSRAIYGQTTTQIQKDLLGLTLRVPVGVVAIITPWNFPLGTLTQKLPAALAAGCTVVCKPASTTPATTLEIVKILDEVGFPKGVVNVITGSGEELGREIATNPMVDKVTLTGSTETGKDLMKLSADTLKKLGMELGGKSPNIVFADANMEDALDGALFGSFFNQGEVCTSGSRLLVQDDIYDEFVDRLVARAEAIRVGDPLSDDTEMGALISESHLKTVLGYVEKGLADGAKLLTGGKRLTDGIFEKGLFMEPTIFGDVKPNMTIAQEEIFGPVLSVIRFKDFDEAMEIANDTCFGLAGAVWTKDIDKAIRATQKIKAGTIWVNHYMEAHPELPFGGVKESGYGKELGTAGLDAFSEVKTVQIHVGSRNNFYKW
ncbi:aldehyde dehydrogenase family protein [Aneurinibacillus sp. Ricciae_BoGa-3]|uniref:aldehyde dehydrogenase family protein n=1 Tax=Aneurinibacillus sp. Ricciae_BoGa-3 TaxID=3022697 RepID=UPI0023403CEE|nr:aldehyde dehydrogenase family protein [Aneurinibacillus sp. Ricciae_BoGa-3]WCK53201.1 aldehyde dehydrogenase family protein [Aneurinibacillus sp. Ricciae_BoGa-3]